ncbi:MAG TPA: type II secretion system protein [Gemmatimonadales bacterium]|nr:type II secretion system protein [Gemmatimonadales bacterium]
MRLTGRAIRSQEGFTLLEAILVVAIFSIVGLALLSLFQGARAGFDAAGTQAFVQRTGTSLVEEMQREFTKAAALQVTGCGPQGGANKAVMYLTQTVQAGVILDVPRCIFEWTATGDPGTQIYRCTLASWNPGAPCNDTPENLLLTRNALSARGNIATQLVAKNIFFQSVASLPNGAGGPGDPGRSVVSPLFDLRFDLDIPGVILEPSNSFPGQRFAASFTTRN